MIRISQRASIFPDSPIRKLVPFADQARAKGRTVYPLNIGQPDLPTPKPFLDALKNYATTGRPYQSATGPQVMDVINQNNTLLHTGDITVDQFIKNVMDQTKPIFAAKS